MLLPATYATALLLTIISMFCWGSWANTFKLTRKWRFELFYFDFAFGVLLTALFAAFTFGSLGDDLSFLDNLFYTAGKRQIAWAFGAGIVFNLGNMLLVAAISIAGLSVAFPIGIGLALVIGVAWSYVLRPVGSPALLFGGAFLVVLAIVFDALAYRKHGENTLASKSKIGLKGLILSLASGVLMGSFYPLVEMSKTPEIGLGPYSIAVIFGIGVVLSTCVFNLYFMNLPVQGQPIPVTAYLARKSSRNHLLGLVGGVIWCVGAVANFVAAGTPSEVSVGPAASYALGQGATVIATLWGLLVWKEFQGAIPRVKVLLAVMMMLFIAGLAMVSIAPLFQP
jgi:glucose uptake protein